MSEFAAGRRRLGRGLEALLGPTAPVAEAPAAGMVELPIAEVDPNPYQPRHDIAEVELAELAASIKSSGLLQPIVVRERPEGRHELIAGERRLRACRALGWSTIPAVKRDVDDRTLLTLALVENLQRDSLSPVDEAQGYRRLIEDFGATQDDVAQAVGRDRSTVANALRLLKLPAVVLVMVHRGELSVGHARALAALDSEQEILRLAREAVSRGWSVREMEDEGRAAAGRRVARRPRMRRVPGQGMSPEARAMEDQLRRRLQTDVRLTLRGSGRGQLRIDFYSNEDLCRVVDLIVGRSFGA